jgi:hypothetical protein
MPGDDPVDVYASHADQLSWVAEDLRKRRVLVDEALRNAFADYIDVRNTEWVLPPTQRLVNPYKSALT